ncbi:hypothetical protein ACFPVT_03830 [Corynebacterium choanae]|uniref:hypothetical protein n=1 Tax=Corynebacterium choanae TaxID=1862358 RepID=UPI000F4F88A4|nr:hypothetical protein [Corynebacterium choanae]
MRILDSALKHGLSHQEITKAFAHPIYEFTERNSPLKVILVELGSRIPYIDIIDDPEALEAQARRENRGILEIIREAVNRYLEAEKAA